MDETNPFSGIMAIKHRDRKLILRRKAIIHINANTAQLRRQQSTQQFLVLQSTDTPPAAMIEHSKWTSTRRRLLRAMDTAGDFGPVAHGDLLVVFVDAFEFAAAHLCGHGFLCVCDPVPEALDVGEEAKVWLDAAHLVFYGLGRSLVTAKRVVCGVFGLPAPILRWALRGTSNL